MGVETGVEDFWDPQKNPKNSVKIGLFEPKKQRFWPPVCPTFESGTYGVQKTSKKVTGNYPLKNGPRPHLWPTVHTFLKVCTDTFRRRDILKFGQISKRCLRCTLFRKSCVKKQVHHFQKSVHRRHLFPTFPNLRMRFDTPKRPYP